MIEPGLCSNPDCGGFFDQSSVEYWDLEQKRIVLICQECARSLETYPQSRYRLAGPNDPRGDASDRI